MPSRGLRLGRFAWAEGLFGTFFGRRSQAFFGLELGELPIQVALLLQELEAMLHRVLVELTERGRPRLLLRDFFLDPIEARQRVALVKSSQRRTDLRLGFRSPTARDQQ